MNLSGKNLRGVDLTEADLSYSNLTGLDLWKTVLRKTNLIGADLSWTDLKGADLSGAYLMEANLGDADLRYATNLTCEQIQEAIINANTQLPESITVTWLSDTQFELKNTLPE